MGFDPQQALAGIIAAADQIAGIRERTGRDAPDVITWAPVTASTADDAARSAMAGRHH